jgi:hypothetical protein
MTGDDSQDQWSLSAVVTSVDVGTAANYRVDGVLIARGNGLK